MRRTALDSEQFRSAPRRWQPVWAKLKESWFGVPMFDIRRRDFIALLTCSVATSPLAARAQEPGKVKRIGFLRVGPPPASFIDGFRQGLRELGFIEGQHFVIDYGLAQSAAQIPGVAAELVHRRVDIVVASGTPSVLPARDVAMQIPVVFVGTLDPVATGLVASLAKPGRNITGLTSVSGDVIAKRLQMTREVLPKLTRIAILVREFESDRSAVCARVPDCGTQTGHRAADRDREQSERHQWHIRRGAGIERAGGGR